MPTQSHNEHAATSLLSIELPCIRCGDCATVCPARLLPQQLFWNIRAGDLAACTDLGLDACLECDACTIVCPSDIPLLDDFREAKAELQQAADELAKANQARRRFQAHQRRHALEDEDKKQRRLAREQAAANTNAGATQHATPAQRVGLPTRMIAAAMARSQLKKVEHQLEVLRGAPRTALIDNLEASLAGLRTAVSDAETALQIAKEQAAEGNP